MTIIPGWDSLDKDTKTALIMAGATTAAGVLNARAEENQYQDTRRDSAITNRAEGLGSILAGETADYNTRNNRNDSRAVNASQMAGRDPLDFQRKRAGFAATGAFLGGQGRSTGPGSIASGAGLPGNIKKYMPSGGIAGSALPASVMDKFSPEQAAAAEGDYFAARQNIDPRLPGPNLGSFYGGAGTEVSNNLETTRQSRLADDQATDDAYDAQAKARRDALLAALDELGPEAEESRTGGGASGGIDWKKWGLGAAGLGAAYLGGRYA